MMQSHEVNLQCVIKCVSVPVDGLVTESLRFRLCVPLNLRTPVDLGDPCRFQESECVLQNRNGCRELFTFTIFPLGLSALC